MKEADVEVILGSQGEVPGSEAANHLRQRAAVHCSGLQRVHSHLRHVARPNVTLLSAVERKAGALAQVTKERVHPAGNTAFAGRCPAPPERLRRALQQHPLEQCYWLRHVEGYAGRTPAGDSH